MKKNLLTKAEIASELGGKGEPLSIRSIERYIKLAGVRPKVKGSGRGKQAKFERADVEKIKQAYLAAAERRENQSTALTTTNRVTPAPVALVAELITSNAEGFRALSDALDSWPVWVTRAEAIGRTGLPSSWFDAAVSKKELPHIGEGRGRRYHRNDVRALAERVKDASYLKQLLQPTESAQS